MKMKQTAPQEIFALLETINQSLGAQVIRSYIQAENQLVFHIAATAISQAATRLFHQFTDITLATVVASHNATADKTKTPLGVDFLFNIRQPQAWVILKIELPETAPTYPAISPTIPAAEWFEREIHDLFGIRATGTHLEPLVLHQDWPRPGHYPMRKDFTASNIPIAEVPHQFHLTEGPGKHQVAVGPIHAGVIEPGHMRFSVTGEKIHQFNVQLFYTHKGIEKMAEGKTVQDGLNLAEHACGMCAFSHSVAYAMAAESLASIRIPERAAYLRTILLELERLANHFWDLSAICQAGGFPFGAMMAARFRETIVQMCHDLTGHRFMRGINTIGGFKRDIATHRFNPVCRDLLRLQTEFDEWQTLILGKGSLLDRLEKTGIIPKLTARKLGLVGPVARGSGISQDVRRDYAYLMYGQFTPTIPSYPAGDALSRTKVRIDEVSVSIRLIEFLASNMPEGPVLKEATPSYRAHQPGIMMVESAKGALVHWLVLNETGRIDRWHVRSASYLNWRGVAEATVGDNIVPDAPLVNKSFNLCYACVDR
jgi:Ni,Fe-hydrogenase III large subunit/Ni,Fe-hydrogenase III component G